MFLGIVQAGIYVYCAQNASSVQTAEHDTADKAKKALSDYISRNKTTFQNGYNAYVIDQDTRKVVASASVPQPTLEWKDA